MRLSFVSRAIRRAVLLSLGTPGLVACGGSTGASAPEVDSGTPIAQTSDAGSGLPDASSCSLAATPTASDRIATSTPPCEGLTYPFKGSPKACGADDAGNLSQSRCQETCPILEGDPPELTYPADGCAVQPVTPGLQYPSPVWQIVCDYQYVSCTMGRRPAGLRACPPVRASHPEAAFLAGAAYLEAASVGAFERLARELVAHGAPRRLRSLARRAARDEVRHARIMKAFAERAGTCAPVPRVTSRRVRSLEAIALENAVEGCVHETLGAAVATFQSRRAADHPFRSAMKRIAEDETRHAELAWAVARWLDTQLDAATRARVNRARARAAQNLLRTASAPQDTDLVAKLGLPTSIEARALATVLASTLWS